jgi:hypothetical protein
VGDRRTKERRLADPARPVEDCEPRGEQVRHDDLPLPLAAAEEQRIEVRVLERSETLERAWRSGNGHVPAAR